MKISLITTIFIFLFSLATSGQSAIEKAKTLYENKRYEEVITLLESTKESDKDYGAAQYYMGRAAFDQERFEEASEYFEQAVETNDKIADYHYWLGNAYGSWAQKSNMFKQGMLAPKMKKAWESAIELDTKNIGARTSLIQYYLQAPGFMGGSVEKAKETANQIIKLNPAIGHKELGNVYFHEKNMVEAEKQYMEMVKADPSTMSGLATFYVNQKQYDKAFTMFEDVLKKNPEDYSVIYQVGKTSALSGQRLERGEECLKKYLTHAPKQNEPSHAGANMRLAQIQEKKGNKAEAKRLFEAALKSDGDLKEAKEGLQRVSK
ncbi:MAG: tetratricopeptide repeat protein [Cyclobacteriaceae bacterium]|nr:tetratricopeptide repeat protein [Cyclobacteriaceae bacterium]